jgi:deoxyribodipyrimidine photo-lyase
MQPKEEINIIWFKRDLRFLDHEAIFHAQQQALPILFVYFFEPSIMNAEDSDQRHWRFIYESVCDMNDRLQTTGSKIYMFHQEAQTVFERLNTFYSIKHVFSYQETGNQLTFDRDRTMSLFFKQHNIIWREFQTNGIIRGLKNRKEWQQLWEAKMTSPPCRFDEKKLKLVQLDSSVFSELKGDVLNPVITARNQNFQKGGESSAWGYFKNFIYERHINYSKNISNPSLSRFSCSRISPYLSYGNISMRMVYQYTLSNYKNSPNKRALANFISRLHWHCHFIQKFESECRYEYENVNRAFDALIKPRNADYIKAWQNGRTGIPIVDACMRCLVSTGYLNFRMRAMVVSFFAYNLWQDWRELHFLARQFLDYEPGIHYPQLQMQSGTTGINTIRIYNPIKNSKQFDEDASFIKKWVPELQHVPAALIHEPQFLTAMEQKMYNCEIGKDYPFPIVDIEETSKYARDTMWGFRKKTAVKTEAKRILEKHVNKAKESDMDV